MKVPTRYGDSNSKYSFNLKIFSSGVGSTGSDKKQSAVTLSPTCVSPASPSLSSSPSMSASSSSSSWSSSLTKRSALKSSWKFSTVTTNLHSYANTNTNTYNNSNNSNRNNTGSHKNDDHSVVTQSASSKYINKTHRKHRSPVQQSKQQNSKKFTSNRNSYITQRQQQQAVVIVGDEDEFMCEFNGKNGKYNYIETFNRTRN